MGMTPPRDLLALAEAIDARLHDAASPARTAIIAEVLSAHEAAPATPGGDDAKRRPRTLLDAACGDSYAWETDHPVATPSPAIAGASEKVSRDLKTLTAWQAQFSGAPTPTREAAHDAERVERPGLLWLANAWVSAGQEVVLKQKEDDTIFMPVWQQYLAAKDAFTAALAAIAPEVRG